MLQDCLWANAGGFHLNQGYFWDGPEPFYEKNISDRVILISVLAGPHT